MKTQQVACDICGHLKGDMNHWWVIVYQHTRKFYWVSPYDGGIKPDEGTECEKLVDICGEECLVKAESKIRQGIDPTTCSISLRDASASYASERIEK